MQRQGIHSTGPLSQLGSFSHLLWCCLGKHWCFSGCCCWLQRGPDIAWMNWFKHSGLAGKLAVPLLLFVCRSLVLDQALQLNSGDRIVASMPWITHCSVSLCWIPSCMSSTGAGVLTHKTLFQQRLDQRVLVVLAMTKQQTIEKLTPPQCLPQLQKHPT